MKIRLIELLCPFDNWHIKEVRALYSKLLSLKIHGFNKTYTDVLPVDHSDLVADHIILCTEESNELTPLSSFKVVKYTVTKRFKFKLPCVSILEGLNKNNIANNHLEYVNELLKNLDNNNEDLFYPSSWTADSRFRGKSEEVLNLKWALLSNVFFYMNNYGINKSLVIGMKHIKTDKLLQSMGYKSINFKNEILDYLENPSFNSEKALLMFLDSYEDQFMHKVFKNYTLYKNRIILGELIKVNNKKKKVA